MTGAGDRAGDVRRITVPAASLTPYATPAVIPEVDRLVQARKHSEAILVAYLTAEEHLRQVFRVKLPRQWTHREFLRRYLRADMGPSGELLTRLYARFEPVRYGRPNGVSSDGLGDLVRALYREPPLRSTHLYVASQLAPLPRTWASGVREPSAESSGE